MLHGAGKGGDTLIVQGLQLGEEVLEKDFADRAAEEAILRSARLRDLKDHVFPVAAAVKTLHQTEPAEILDGLGQRTLRDPEVFGDPVHALAVLIGIHKILEDLPFLLIERDPGRTRDPTEHGSGDIISMQDDGRDQSAITSHPRGFCQAASFLSQ